MKAGLFFMSGIYGVMCINKINSDDYLNLSKWNSMYGDQKEEFYFEDRALIGIIPEKFKDYEYSLDNSILRYESKIGVVDSLIFSEVVKNSTDEWYLHTGVCKNGINFLKEINGDFAGAIWDSKEHELLLYRDHTGVRPLFYYVDDNKVIFSSDIRGITSISDIDASVDDKWIFYNVTDVYSITATDTEYKNIKCVPPGGCIKFSFMDGRIVLTCEKYWIPGEKRIKLGNRDEYAKELRKLVEDAVRIRANATILPIGAELSGGLDSGVIDMLLAKMGRKCFYYSWSPSKDVLPYAVGDERIVIDDICKKADIVCHYGGLRVDFSDHKQMSDRLPITFDDKTNELQFQFKYAFPNYINTPQIYETASVMQENGVRLIFTGHAGDEGVSHRSNSYELFYNHEYYRYLRLMYSRSSIYKHRVINTLKLIAENQKVAKETLREFLPYSDGGLSILRKEFIDELKPEGKKFLFAYDPRNYIRNGGIRNRLDNLAFYGACTGTRYVAPYTDYRLIDFALGIPRYLYHNWYINRYIFREAFKDLMPESLYRLRDKVDHSYDNLPKQDKDDKSDTEEKTQNYQKEEIIKFRKEFVEMLNKDIWSKYLDFDALDKWTELKTDPLFDEPISKALSKCVLAEYMVKRSREIRRD